MSCIILRGRWCDIVLNVHAPTEDKIDDVKDNFCEELVRVFDKLHKYHMKILLRHSSAEVNREDIFRPTVWSESLHKISNDSGVRIINFATSKNLVAKSATFTHRNIHKFTWTCDRKTHNQVDHILINRKWHSSILMSDSSGQQIVILTTIWWWRKLGRDWQ
jgi:hypothetical protein